MVTEKEGRKADAQLNSNQGGFEQTVGVITTVEEPCALVK